MSRVQLVLIVATVFVAMIVWARWIVKRNLSGYQRRFPGAPMGDNPSSRNSTSSFDDAAFPITSTIYLGDGGSSTHSHHSIDCGHHADAGAGCADGGGGGSH